MSAAKAEVQSKLDGIRTHLAQHRIWGVHFRGVDWFSWVTGGGSATVILTAEIGVAEVLVTQDRAFVLTNKIEQDRLAQEEISGDFEILAVPWQSPKAVDAFLKEQRNSGVICSDRPVGDEIALPEELRRMKLTLHPEEMRRYREIGRKAAEAMTEALTPAQPDWTEYRLAGEGAKALWSRGLEPTLVMVGGSSRVARHRHPIATQAPLGDSAMMVFCARGKGLYANLTRFVFFREPTAPERAAFAGVARVESAAFRASRPGRKLSEAYEEIKAAYAELGWTGEIDRHHQGGPTGYLSRECVASPDTAHFVLEENMALAWNPSLPGAKIEDTVLLTSAGIEPVTVDPTWPTFELDGRKRPEIWVRT